MKPTGHVQQRHARFLGGAVAFAGVARAAGGGDVGPELVVRLPTAFVFEGSHASARSGSMPPACWPEREEAPWTDSRK